MLIMVDEGRLFARRFVADAIAVNKNAIRGMDPEVAADLGYTAVALPLCGLDDGQTSELVDGPTRLNAPDIRDAEDRADARWLHKIHLLAKSGDFILDPDEPSAQEGYDPALEAYELRDYAA